MLIVIDGPAGTGKTTLARQVAEILGYHYFDTGAMYRSFTYLLWKNRVDIKEKESIQAWLARFQFDIELREGASHYVVNGEEVTEIIRHPEVTRLVSEVAALPSVREALVPIQRAFSIGKNAVFEGRDMGTVVFPHAEVKIFLTAKPEVRAQRRFQELLEKGLKVEYKQILKEIMERDYYDSNREMSPLAQAVDAHLIDTSHLTIPQVIEQILKVIKSRA